MTPRAFVGRLRDELPPEEFDVMALLAAAGEMGANKADPSSYYAPDGAG